MIVENDNKSDEFLKDAVRGKIFFNFFFDVLG
jgi:hypothetical protein